MAYLTQNSILRISDEKTMRLIELYEKEECLWNTNIEDYKNRSKRQEANERIAEILDVEHFTYHHVIIKFKNLRSSYCQELKKIENSVAAGDEPVYRPRVFWFNKMDSFLRPHLQLYRMAKLRASKVAAMSEEENETVDMKKEYDNDFYSEDNDDDYLKPLAKRSRNVSSESSQSITQDGSNVSNLDIPFQQVTTNVDNRFVNFDKCIAAIRNVLAQQDSDAYFASFIKCISNLTRNMPVQHDTEVLQDDSFDIFGKYVSAMLKNMPVKRAIEIQPEIVKLLISGTIENKEGLYTESDQNQDL